MNTITLLDGGMGQELLRITGAAPTNLWATQVMRDQPDAVAEVHKLYFEAGADIATTNTYTVHHDRLLKADADAEFKPLHVLACETACRARDAYGTSGKGMIAGGMGPLGASYRTDIAPSADVAADFFAEIAQIHAPYVDVHLIETAATLEAARGAAMGAGVTGKPIWLSVSLDDEDGTKLRSGEAIQDLLAMVDDLNIAALLINCSRPEAVTTGMGILAKASCPTGAYANGFTKISAQFLEDNPTVDALTARTDLDPAAYLAHAQEWREAGASIIGGCCEVGPAHIRALARAFKPDFKG